MTDSTRIPAPLSLILSLISLVLFPLGIFVMEQTHAWRPALMVAIPALAIAVAGLVVGCVVLQKKPSGKRYGYAMGGSLTGGFSIVFWIVMVPMLLLIAYPAKQNEHSDPLLEQSKKQMVILVRHLKTFEQEFGRLPVRMEELVDKGYIPVHLLYDPRQQRKDAPSYRLMVQKLPPEDQWASVPVLEGRIPDADGARLSAFANETTGTLPPAPHRTP